MHVASDISHNDLDIYQAKFRRTRARIQCSSFADVDKIQRAGCIIKRQFSADARSTLRDTVINGYRTERDEIHTKIFPGEVK